MLPTFFPTNSIIQDPFKLGGLRTNVYDQLNLLDDEQQSDISPESDFGNLLLKALGDVNTLQMEPARLNEKMITDPNSVDVHDITLASAKATLSLSITKELMDRAIRAYKELINVR